MRLSLFTLQKYIKEEQFPTENLLFDITGGFGLNSRCTFCRVRTLYYVDDDITSVYGVGVVENNRSACSLLLLVGLTRFWILRL